MSDNQAIMLLIAALVLGALSCIVAVQARNSPTGSGGAWGLLGPVGWIVAALLGVQDAIREQNAPRD